MPTDMSFSFAGAPILKGLFFSVLLTVAAYRDLKTREIPDRIPVLLLCTGFIGIHPLDSCLGLVLTGLPYFLAAVLVRHGGGIGGGDWKLMSACGFVLGVWGGILQSVISLTLAVLAGCAAALIRKKPIKEIRLPLAPFFCAGGILSYAVLTFSAAFLR